MRLIVDHIFSREHDKAKTFYRRVITFRTCRAAVASRIRDAFRKMRFHAARFFRRPFGIERNVERNAVEWNTRTCSVRFGKKMSTFVFPCYRAGSAGKCSAPRIDVQSASLATWFTYGKRKVDMTDVIYMFKIVFHQFWGPWTGKEKGEGDRGVKAAWECNATSR